MSGSLANPFGQLASTFIMDAWKFTTATHTKQQGHSASDALPKATTSKSLCG